MKLVLTFIQAVLLCFLVKAQKLSPKHDHTLLITSVRIGNSDIFTVDQMTGGTVNID